MGRGFGERLPLLDRAVAIREASVGVPPNAAWLDDALRDAAFGYEDAGRPAEAQSRLVKCVAAYTKVRRGSNGPGLLRLFGSLALLLIFPGAGPARRISNPHRGAWPSSFPLSALCPKGARRWARPPHYAHDRRPAGGE